MTNIRINELFESLKNSFNDRYSKSEDKMTLLNIEIDSHELLFDEKKFPVWMRSNNRPLSDHNLNVYTDVDIIGIREAYIKYIVNGADINEAGNLYKDKNGMYQRRPPSAFQIHYFIEAKIRYLYLNWLREYNMPKKEAGNINYVLNESIIIKLYEEYGAGFPGESKELWKQRWINSNDTLTAINIGKFRNGNNKHLILTILHEAHHSRFLKVDNMLVYTKKRWGLNSYHSALTKYLGFDKVKNCYTKPHPELKNITDILKLESF